jgi:transposase
MTDKIRVSEFDVFCGMDVDKSKYVNVLLDWQDKIRRFQTSSDAGAVLKYARKHYPDKRIAFVYEAGPTGFGLYDALTSAGEKCLVAAPSMIPKKPGQRVKNNRLDAYELAKNLRGGQIDGITIPSAPYRDLRHLVQLRDTRVREVAGYKKRIKALLLVEGLEFPGLRWNEQTESLLAQIKCREMVKFKLMELIDSLQTARTKLLKTNHGVRRFCRSNEEINTNMMHLMSLGCIGWITASHFLARIGGSKVESIRKTCGFLGLGTSENSTGNRIRRGEITGVGDRRLRAKIIQASWTAVRTQQEFRAIFNKVLAKNPDQYGKNKAIVAVGRTLVARMHCLVRDQRDYQKKPETQTNRKQLEAASRPDPMKVAELRTSLGEGPSAEARFCRKGAGKLPLQLRGE